MIRSCVECDEEFDANSPEKKRVGGKINTCIFCSEETAVKYAGVAAADGKQSQATILKFNSEKDRSRYIAFWQNNSGLHKGKVCSLGKHLSTDPGIKFETIVAHVASNHKGRS